MANSDKNIIITPNRNASGIPTATFVGAGNSEISLAIDSGTVGELNFVSSGSTIFSVSQDITENTSFSVSTNSGISIIDINDEVLNIGAKNGSVVVKGDGFSIPSFGTTSLPSQAQEGTIVYDDNHKVVKLFDGRTWKSVGNRMDGLTADTAAESTEQLLSDYPDSPTGFYWLKVDGIPYLFWVDTVYEGGGWILVLNNRINTGGMNNLNYASATKRVVNYRGNYGTYPTSRPDSFNLWIGLDAWVKLANANFSTANRVCEIVSTAYQPLGAVHNHTKRASWGWSGWNATYAWQGLVDARIDFGGSLPGLYTYHAANGYNLTTFDVDQDANGANCATFYSNNPNWYGSCWSGAPFGGLGGGYQDAWYWDGSGGDYHNYGALYVR